MSKGPIKNVSEEVHPRRQDNINATDCLYITNIPYDTIEDELQDRFPGSTAIRIPTDKETGATIG